MERFSFAHFRSCTPEERKALCAKLAPLLAGRLQPATFHADVLAVVADLRALGHDLWSFDEDDDLEIWTPDYTKGPAVGLTITMRPLAADIEWTPSDGVSTSRPT